MNTHSGFKPIAYSLRIWGDFQIGSGVGVPGVLDEMVVRDHEDFAYVPGSEIKGLVRESCRQLIEYRCRDDEHIDKLICQGQKYFFLGDKEKESPTEYCSNSAQTVCLICALFGSPLLPASLWFSPAEYAGRYRDNTKSAELEFRDSRSRAQASIDPRTRRAQAHHLFSTEVVAPAADLYGSIECMQPIRSVANNQDSRAWLAASLLFTCRLGGGRRRGRGRCRFEFRKDGENNGNQAALDALTNWLGGTL